LLAYRDQSRRRSPFSEGLGDRPVLERLHPKVGCLPRGWARVDPPNTVLANEPMVE
jgi:hypothetical protein